MPKLEEHEVIIKKLIKKHNTIYGAAKAANMNYHTLWKLANGTNQFPNGKTMKKLKAALNK